MADSEKAGTGRFDAALLALADDAVIDAPTAEGVEAGLVAAAGEEVAGEFLSATLEDFFKGVTVRGFIAFARKAGRSAAKEG